MDYTLDFERPVSELENQIKELIEFSSRPNVDLSSEIKALQNKVDQLIQDIYGNLTPWERVQLSRHPLRPHTIHYIQNIITDFYELAGDRKFGHDQALIAGLGSIGPHKVAIIGIEKGQKTKEKVQRNFGMPNPEGYRKALRVMELAGQFRLPIISFVDTPGAYPGIGAEERGQSQAIAENLAQMFDIPSPFVSLVIGEGGSGGALGIAVADRVLMLEYSIYSVISPESCASILWADPKYAEQAANSLKLGPKKALELQIIDRIVSEPPGGAHRHSERTFQIVKDAIIEELNFLKKVPEEELLARRFAKFRQMGNSTIEIPEDNNLPVYFAHYERPKK